MNRKTSILLASVALFFYSQVATGAVLNRTDSAVWSEASRILIPFVQNKGQYEDPNVLFYSNTFACTVVISKDGTIGYRLAQDTSGRAKQPPKIRERISGALISSPAVGCKATTKVNHFSGKDPKQWVTDIATFNTVNMGEIYKGIMLELQARANNVEKIFHVLPAADPKKIRMRIEGARALKLTPKGELDVLTGQGRMRFSKPVAYQLDGGRKTAVDVAYTVDGNAYGFQVAAYDKTKELIIDPLITAVFEGVTEKYSRATCMATDSKGNIYVAGKSGRHAVVFKFDRKLENALTSTFIGTLDTSDVYDMAITDVYDMAVDSQDAIYLVGRTSDKNFPVKENAFDKELIVTGSDIKKVDGFVIKYNADLNKILAATYIGAGKPDAVYGVAVDSNDHVYVVGQTTNPVSDPNGNIAPFPTTPGAYDTAYGSYEKTKAFIAHLDGNLQNLLASTLLGDKKEEGNFNDIAHAVAIDAEGNVVVAGRTQSKDFPVTAKCADAKFEGNWESFVSKFDPDLQNLLASTFLGGANTEKINALAIDSNNEIVVAGLTLSSDFPVVKDNFDTSFNIYEDGFVTRFDSALSTIKASTFLGGKGADQVGDLAIADDGNVLLCGGTGSSDFPVTENSIDRSFNGGSEGDVNGGDSFFMILDPGLATAEVSTFLGGNEDDYAIALVINGEDIVLAGETKSTNFPYMKNKKGYSDAFICRFNPTETPDPQPSAVPGNWKSKDRSTGANWIYLDIDICEDGTFAGMYQGYLCGVIDGMCIIGEEVIGPDPVTGTIDFKKNTGTITLDEKCKDISFSIYKQNPDELMITLNGCPLDSFRSAMKYQGESEKGKCSNTTIDSDEKDPDKKDADNKEPDKKKDTGGGGGGCFVSFQLWGVL